jgi:excisionase family DNA binding protein
MAIGPLFLDEEPEMYLSSEDAPTRRHLPRPAVAAGAPAVLSVDEAAALLRVNRKTLYEAVRRGQVPGARRIGRLLRLDRETLVAWMRCQGNVLDSPAQGRAASPGGKRWR